jgi:hypothetical protein
MQAATSPNSAFSAVGGGLNGAATSSSIYRSMESKHKSLVILRCKVVVVG